MEEVEKSRWRKEKGNETGEKSWNIGKKGKRNRKRREKSKLTNEGMRRGRKLARGRI